MHNTIPGAGMRKYLCLLLCLILCLVSISGCGSTSSTGDAGDTSEAGDTVNTVDTDSTEDADSTSEIDSAVSGEIVHAGEDSTSENGLSEEDAAAAAAKEAAVAEMLATAYASYNPDDVVMSINGEPVTWSQFFYCLRSYYSTMSQMGLTDWDADASVLDSESAGETVQGFIFKTIEEGIFQPYWTIEQKARDLGVTLSEEDEQALDDTYQQTIQLYFGGDEQAFLDYMSENYFPLDFYNRMNRIDALSKKLFEHFYGENGDSLPDSDALEYAENGGYIQAKHILIRTVDDNQESLTDEQIAEKLQQATDIAKELQAITDHDALVTRFDELMQEVGEDPGMTTYPDGYVFPDGYMVSEFREAAEALGEYEVSDPVETSYGYHVILRLPLNPDSPEVSNRQSYSIRSMAASKLYQDMLEEWFEAAQVSYQENLLNLDLNQLLPLDI